MTDASYMRRALALARRGGVAVRPNPMVGAVVVRDGKIVGKGWHRAYGGPHAEVEALKDAGERAQGATLYVTLEPCNHQGKTPPCSEAVRAAGIARVVVAMEDPNPNVAGGGNQALLRAGVCVECGCLEAEAKELNVSWVKRTVERRPLRYGLCPLSLNGIVCAADEIEAEPRFGRLMRWFDEEQMVLQREKVVESLASGGLDRLVVVHRPEFSRDGDGDGGVFLPSGLKLQLLRVRRVGRFGVSTYRILPLV